MLEVSIAAVVIAVVGWDAFRRHLAQVKRESVSTNRIMLLEERQESDIGSVFRDLKRLEEKLNKVTTDLGALSITQTPALRGRGR